MAVITSTVAAPSSATVVANSWWVRDLSDSSLDMAVDVANDPLDLSIKEDQAVYSPLGRRYPLIVRDMIRGDVLHLKFWFATTTILNQFKLLRSKQRTQLLQNPYGYQWYVAWGGEMKETVFNTNPVSYEVTIDAIEVGNPANVYALS